MVGSFYPPSRQSVSESPEASHGLSEDECVNVLCKGGDKWVAIGCEEGRWAEVKEAYVGTLIGVGDLQVGDVSTDVISTVHVQSEGAS